MPLKDGLDRIRNWAIQPRGLACLAGLAFIAAAVIADYVFNPSGILVVLLVLAGVSGIAASIFGIQAAVGWLRQFGSVAGTAFFAAYGALILVAIPVPIINFSSDHVPRSLHIALLTVISLLLALGFYSISTERLRTRFLKASFDDNPVLLATIYSALLLITTGRVLASFTFILFENGVVELSSNIVGRALVEERLLDFYMWHFLEVVPFLQIPEVLNLKEPITYSGTVVGTLVLLFQGLWVLILIPTVRSFSRQPREREYEDVISLYKRAVDHTGSIVNRVTPEQLDGPTPCEGWDTGTLLNHIVFGNHMWANPIVIGEETNTPDENTDFLGANPARAYRKSAEAAIKSLGKSGMLDRHYRSPRGEEVWGNAQYLAAIEITVHCWDLAKATGQDPSIDDDIAIGVLNMANQVVPTALPRPPTSGYKNPVQVPLDASPTEKLVAFLGRDPHWRPPRV